MSFSFEQQKKNSTVLNKSAFNLKTCDITRTLSQGNCNQCRDNSHNNFSFNFGNISVYDTGKISELDQSITDQTAGAGVTPPVPVPVPAAKVPTLTPSLSVDRIDIINSPAGAIGGYPAITSGDLNSPGPFNNAATGGVNNVHQIHFHLDHGNSALLTPTREIQRSAWIAGVESKNPADIPLPSHLPFVGPVIPGGFDGILVGPDGPAAHEVQRPSNDKIVIADAPGIDSLTAAAYPFIYRSHFALTVAGPLFYIRSGFIPTPTLPAFKDIARIRYDVRIEKKSAADVPNTENSITAVSKDDLVRGKSLP